MKLLFPVFTLLLAFGCSRPPNEPATIPTPFGDVDLSHYTERLRNGFAADASFREGSPHDRLGMAFAWIETRFPGVDPATLSLEETAARMDRVLPEAPGAAYETKATMTLRRWPGGSELKTIRLSGWITRKEDLYDRQFSIVQLAKPTSAKSEKVVAPDPRIPFPDLDPALHHAMLNRSLEFDHFLTEAPPLDQAGCALALMQEAFPAQPLADLEFTVLQAEETRSPLDTHGIGREFMLSADLRSRTPLSTDESATRFNTYHVGIIFKTHPDKLERRFYIRRHIETRR